MDATYVFGRDFTVGRDEDCDVVISSGLVSRQHLEFIFDGEDWFLRDTNSTNGTFHDGRRCQELQVDGADIIVLGINGPQIRWELTDPITVEGNRKVNRQNKAPQNEVENEFRPTDTINWSSIHDESIENVGDNTRVLRQIYQEARLRERRKYQKWLFLLLIVAFLGGTFAIYQFIKAPELDALAREKFYLLKTIEMELARLKKEASGGNDPQTLAVASDIRQRKNRLEKEVQQMRRDLGDYEQQLSQEDRLVLKITRIFGEYEYDIPDGFFAEVRLYIAKWQGPYRKRLQQALLRAKRRNYDQEIVRVMLSNNLPPQFFYLALQESNFNARSVGPNTRYGRAKGIWQFIPSTGANYGLRIGPLRDLGQYDELDERFDFPKATRAAANYIRYIYDTDAQASGLLVIASYNWGEGKVIKLIRQLPKTPKDRNFWQLLRKHKSQIPKETYDYVFLIIALAVIGEDPQLFGFDFENPLSAAIKMNEHWKSLSIVQ